MFFQRVNDIGLDSLKLQKPFIPCLFLPLLLQLTLRLHFFRLRCLLIVGVGLFFYSLVLLLHIVLLGQEPHDRLELNQRKGALLVVYSLLEGKILICF
jgi:hypothetical protein